LSTFSTHIVHVIAQPQKWGISMAQDPRSETK
jgi:hypothetical protein